MTEDDARAWITTRYGSDRAAKIAEFLAMVVAENAYQNLIAPSTVDHLWSRHATDSAQLDRLAPEAGQWLDVGTGGGFPGIVIAVLRDAPIIMVEPRKRRVEFLETAIKQLNLANAAVVCSKAENVDLPAAIISARAVASVEKLLQATAHCATATTRWILPRGRLSPDQLASLRQQQRGMMFHVEHSLTDPNSSILIVETKR